MIIVDNVVLSDDIMENFFVCNLEKCKGACCVEGDLGAPLDKEEITFLTEALPDIKPYLSKKGMSIIEEKGVFVEDHEGDQSTPTIDDKECAFSFYDERGHLKCGIEKAWQEGKTSFRKPISCHLYPIRITKYDQYDAVNYDRWDICDPACKLGHDLGVPLYTFLKESLIRKYGEEWYARLLKEINARQKEAPGKLN